MTALDSHKRPADPNPFLEKFANGGNKKLVLHLPPRFVKRPKTFQVEDEPLDHEPEIKVAGEAAEAVDASGKDNGVDADPTQSDDGGFESEAEAEDVPPGVKDEMDRLLGAFPGLSHKYRLVDKIGEGTFSSVYKAVDLQGILTRTQGSPVWRSPPAKGHHQQRQNAAAVETRRRQDKPKHGRRAVVALKRIYVTSSPQRIYNELHLLHSLVGCPNVAPLLDAIRFEDQVIAVLPYYKHADFRDFYRDLPLAGIRTYMKELLEALAFVHEKKIIHRDIKPTNFLYNPFTRRGVLVDFGLAERESETDAAACPCVKGGLASDEVPPANSLPTKGYLKDDPRPGRRANRAGTRGFRAPEVLFKCPNQTRKLDVWSAGVMLLTLLARRFPFFNSTDDIDALAELTNVFGAPAMKKCARLHGLGFECNLPRVEVTHPLGEIIAVAVLLDAKEGDTFAEDSPAWELLTALDRKGKPVDDGPVATEYAEALELLDSLLRLDSRKRVTAEEALDSAFFRRHEKAEPEEVMLD